MRLLLAIFFGLILWGQFSGANTRPSHEFQCAGDILQSGSGKDCALPGHLPFLPQSEESESEAPETLDLSESNLAGGSAIFQGACLLFSSSSRITAGHFSAAFHDREQISLYILHHAWRSHIS